MREPNDWRLTFQEEYLKDATLRWAEYKAPRPDWDHDHCEFCWDKFMQGRTDTLTEGYATTDGRRWVCKQCFEDFKQEFGFKVV
jgi:hypothetical protein